MVYKQIIPAMLVIISALCVETMGQAPPPSSTPPTHAGNDRAKLLAAVPRLDSQDTALSSFEIEGKLPSPYLPTEPIHAQVGWHRGASSSMLLSSSRTGTPIVWAADNDAIVFDCSSSSLLVIRDLHPHVTFRIHKDQVDYLYQLHEKEVGHTIDLQSFVRAYEPTQLNLLDGGHATLAGLSPSGRSRIKVNYHSVSPVLFSGFEISAADQRSTLLNSVNAVTINKPLSAPLNRSPQAAIEEHGIPTVEITDRSIVGLYRIGQAMRRSLILHIAVEEPQYRQHVSQMIDFMDIDWESCERNYKQLAPALKSIYKESRQTEAKLAKRPIRRE